MSRILCKRFCTLKSLSSFSSLTRSDFAKTSAINGISVSCYPSRQYARGSKFRGPPRTEGEEAGEGKELGQKDVETLLKHSTVGYPQDFKSPDHMWETNPYQQDGTLEQRAAERNQAAKSFRPTVNPNDTSIILFPGQGVQKVGMCKDLIKYPLVKDLFEVASSILGYDLLKICLEGPQDILDQTKYCQPAVLVSSLAAVEWLKEERPSAIEGCIATAGFSVGELTALIFAGALTFESAIKLVRARAEGMQYSAEMVASGMATVFYGPDSTLGHACKSAVEYCVEKGIENPVCSVANYLYPHCKVVAGNHEALEYLAKNASKFKLKKVKRLPVNGAFHTPLMLPALDPFKAALRKVQIQDPLVYVHSNIDGKFYRNAAHIRKQLPSQIVKPVKWEQTLHILYERPDGLHFPRTFECGPGKSLRAILKQVNSKAWDSTVSYSC